MRRRCTIRVEGVSTFTKTFAEPGPRDHQGRSLRDFDMHKRMFRYPLSFMIYSRPSMLCRMLFARRCTSGCTMS